MHTAYCIAYTTTSSDYLVIRDLTNTVVAENNNNQDSRRINIITYIY